MDPEVKARLDSIDASISKLTNLCTAKFASLEKRMDSLEARMDSLEARMDSLEARMDSLEARMDFMERKQDTLQASIEALENTCKSMDQRLTSVERELAEFKEETRINFITVNEKLDCLDTKANLINSSQKGTDLKLEPIADRINMIGEKMSHLVPASQEHKTRLAKVETAVAQINATLNPFICKTNTTLEHLQNQIDFIAEKTMISQPKSASL